MHSNQGFSWRGAGLCAVTTHASTNASCKAKQMRHCYFMPVLIVFPFALAKAKKNPTVIKKKILPKQMKLHPHYYNYHH